jgi:hypothetical protein
MPCRWCGLKARQKRGRTDQRLAVTAASVRAVGQEGKEEDFHRINRGPPRRYRLAGGVEADPGLGGQGGDPLGP